MATYQAVPTTDIKINSVTETTHLKSPRSPRGSSDPNEFHHLDTDERVGQKLPPSIYSAAMISTLGVTSSDLQDCSSILWAGFIVGSQWLLLVVNYLFCYVIIKQIRQIRDKSPTCDAEPNLLLLGVAIFSIYNVGEMAETLWIGNWIYNFPSSDSHQALRFAEDENGDKKIVSGMTSLYRAWCFAFVVFPKLCIGFALAWYGSGFLLTSDDNESLILNTVALTFITQIDELMYLGMVPGNIKVVLDQLPAFTISQRSKKLDLCRPIIVSVVIACILYFTYHGTCLLPLPAASHPHKK